ncbi:type II toxin-antitoxin system RelE/ParE family toxin [Nostocaceae cyanobacterium CENA369]|uniref:Type II toxin-antitoxin system RelE/ParE family toxin n=1 Tax=Dendronalium phyllosphericum CENA369 TaxID=1725256 RepID=A0A8J7I8C7_9NOST|nr:type II toxin-antitoxin system RelE/ParE family toxin [Dendronalium phyllosphericum]MBH8575798.1 type II toxin-antitoxin system RelE/ParE family toxin [Dendronalium phyllosphericum CENA369]
MDYQVVLSSKAVGDLEAIVRYIAASNPEAARKLGQQLLQKVSQLREFPFQGQKVPEFDDPNIRQLILKPYRIIYRVEEDSEQISIARFWHSAQDDLML